MLNYFQSLYIQYSEFTSSNQMLGAVAAGLLLTWITLIFKSVPQKIFIALKNRYIFSISFDTGSEHSNVKSCEKIIAWTNKHKTIFHSRTTIPVYDNNDEFEIGVGTGNNLVRYEGNFYIVSVSLEKSEMTFTFNQNVTIKCLSSNQKNLENILLKILSHEENDGYLIMEPSSNYWRETRCTARNLSTVITSGDVGNEILMFIMEFSESKEWYRSRGIPYKASIMLYGPPGTGKTSIIKAIATETKRKLYIINLSTVTDSSFSDLVRCIPPNSILALEDVDCVGSFKSRSSYADVIDDSPVEIDDKTTTNPVNPNKVDSDKGGRLNLSTVLNVMDGVRELNDLIIVTTTNFIEKIDPAITRKGRTDLSIEVKHMDSEAVNKYSQLMYGKPAEFVGEIKGCDIQSIVINNKRDHAGFIKDLKKFSKPIDVKEEVFH